MNNNNNNNSYQLKKQSAQQAQKKETVKRKPLEPYLEIQKRCRRKKNNVEIKR